MYDKIYLHKNMNYDVTATMIVKNCGYFVAGIVGSVGLSHEAIIILSILMIIDTITGVAKSGMVKGWSSITSLKLTAGVISKLLVILVPLVIALAGRGVGLDLTYVASSSLSIIIFAEAYSILGNIHSAVTKKESVEFDAIGYILDKFRDIIENFLITTKKK